MFCLPFSLSPPKNPYLGVVLLSNESVLTPAGTVTCNFLVYWSLEEQYAGALHVDYFWRRLSCWCSRSGVEKKKNSASYGTDKVCKWAKVSRVLMYSCKIVIFLNHHDWKYTEVAVSPPWNFEGFNLIFFLYSAPLREQYWDSVLLSELEIS